MVHATSVIDLDGQWVENAFQHLDDRVYRARLYRLLRKRGCYAILRILMVTVESRRYAKMANSQRGRKLTPEAKTKISAAWTPEKRAKMSARVKGENNPFYGRTHTEEFKAKQSMANKELFRNPENHPCFGRKLTEEHKSNISAAFTPEKRAKISALQTGKGNSFFGKIHTEEHNSEISAAMTGKNNPRWQGGISFEPYCSRFNSQLKEQIRNRDNRNCVLCQKGEIQNGRRLSVHHIDGDKMQGCNNKPWYLCALCLSCNSKPDTIEKEFLIVANLVG